jgi:hypothetical protein
MSTGKSVQAPEVLFDFHQFFKTHVFLFKNFFDLPNVWFPNLLKTYRLLLGGVLDFIELNFSLLESERQVLNFLFEKTILWLQKFHQLLFLLSVVLCVNFAFLWTIYFLLGNFMIFFSWIILDEKHVNLML